MNFCLSFLLHICTSSLVLEKYYTDAMAGVHTACTIVNFLPKTDNFLGCVVLNVLNFYVKFELLVKLSDTRALSKEDNCCRINTHEHWILAQDCWIFVPDSLILPWGHVLNVFQILRNIM